jgi:hypothetical protein
MDDIMLYSNPNEVLQNARVYLGKTVDIKFSTRNDKKYMVKNPYDGKWIHFGQMGYEDYTKHRDIKRRERYLSRAKKIKGNWRNDPYSPNNLSINILWK